MSLNDIYCAACGAALSPPLFSATDGQDESGPPTTEEMKWLMVVRILYRSSYFSMGFRRVNLSSIVMRGYDGKFYATGHLPHDKFDNPEPDSFEIFTPYKGTTLFSMPLHHSCSELLAKFLDYSVGTTPSSYLGVLFRALRSFHDEASKVYRGKIKYGRITKQQGQFWYPTISTKSFAYDPFFTSPELLNYYQNLPEIEQVPEEDNDCKVCYIKATLETDPFSKLPPELLMMILIHLPVQSIRNLRHASVAITRLRLPGSFWKEKLKRDMPWLWDFPYQEAEQTSRNLNWRKIFNDIYIGSQGNGRSPFLSLANRHRVWRICEQIAPRYADFQAEREMVEARG